LVELAKKLGLPDKFAAVLSAVLGVVIELLPVVHLSMHGFLVFGQKFFQKIF